MSTTPDPQVHTLSSWRKVALWPLVALLRLWAGSLRIRVSEEGRALLGAHPGPLMYVIWHNRLFTATEILRRLRPHRVMYGLVSASRDGAWLAALFEACGLGAVRGSSSRLGAEAARGLIEAARAGKDVGITPDGPKGPVYEVKPGALLVARRARPVVVLVGIDYESAWRLPSWDGFYVPRPFSTLHVAFQITEVGAEGDRDEGARAMGRALAAINPDRIAAPLRKRA